MIHTFSIDLEDWYHGIELPREEWRDKERRLEKGLDVILELLDQNETKATFFSLGWIGEHYPKVIKKIANEGHEIGAHSYYHEKVYDQNPETFREDAMRTKEVLEAITGEKVRGYRAPFFSITESSIWALEILKSLGYEYDSSIAPIKTWRYGIANAPDTMYRIKECGLIEYPISRFRFLRKKWGSGGAYFRIFPLRNFLRDMHHLDASGLPFMFYIHPWEYDPGHPVVQMERKAKFTHYRNLRHTKQRTQSLISAFNFDRADKVIADYSSRNTIPELSIEKLIAGV